MAGFTLIRSWPSLAIGAGFATLTGWTLTADVIAGAPITPAHGLSIGAIVAAIGAGHYFMPALKRGDVVRAAMLGIVFTAATAFVTVSSAMKNAETGATKTARIEANNKARAREEKALTSAETALAGAQAQLTAGCVAANKLSKGQCDGLRSTIAGLQPMIVGHKATLKDLGPELAPNGGFKAAAKALGSVPGITATPDAIEERLVDLMPFVAVLIGEIATIAFIGLGLGHRAPAPTTATLVSAKPAPTPNGGTRRSRRGATTKDSTVLAFVDGFRRRHGRNPSIPEMTAAFPAMPSSTAQRYRRAAPAVATTLLRFA